MLHLRFLLGKKRAGLLCQEVDFESSRTSHKALSGGALPMGRLEIVGYRASEEVDFVPACGRCLQNADFGQNDTTARSNNKINGT